MWKFAVSIYVYKIKIPICVILPGTVFVVTGLSASFSNNQQFLDALPSSMGASSTGFSFDREVITPTDCDQETPSFLLMNCCTWCLFLLSISWSFISISDIEKSTDNSIVSIYALL